jgi:hypothetical protein
MTVTWLVPSYHIFVFFVAGKEKFNHEGHEEHEDEIFGTQPE